MYEWCADDPADLAIPRLPPQMRIPELLDATESDALPFVGDGAPGREEPLVAIRDPRIRSLAAYWHSGWQYSIPETLLRTGAAGRLSAAADSLPAGFGLAVWDAWRDPELQRVLHDAAYADPELLPGFVSPPSDDPRTPPPHATGGTVDLTLTWAGRPLKMGTGFDAFVPAASARSQEEVPDYASSAIDRDLRRMLRTAMVGAGFAQLACEWWHFEYGTRLWAAVFGGEPLYPASERPFQLS